SKMSATSVSSRQRSASAPECALSKLPAKSLNADSTASRLAGLSSTIRIELASGSGGTTVEVTSRLLTMMKPQTLRARGDSEIKPAEHPGKADVQNFASRAPLSDAE